MIGATPPRRALHWLYSIHLWVGIVVSLQLLLWTASGLFMTSNAIDEVRGTNLRRAVATVDLRRTGPVLAPSAVLPPEAVLVTPLESAELVVVRGRPAYRLASGDRHWLVDARTGKDWIITAADAIAIARAGVTLVPPLTATRVPDPPPLELRRPGAAWMVSASDDTHVYIGTTGEVMAVRTDLWRWFDFAWGLHILDLQGREDTHHPLLVASAALSLASVLSGIILIVVHFRRRRRA